MLRVTLTNLLTHWRRLIAVALAIVIASAFVAAASILGGSVQASLGASVGSAYAGSDLVVDGWASTDDAEATEDAPVLDDAALDAVHGVTGVETATLVRSTTVMMRVGDASVQAGLEARKPAPFDTTDVVAGDEPAGPGEALVDEGTADRYGIAVGDVVTVIVETGEGTPEEAAVTVTGIAAAGADPFRAGMPTAIVDVEAFAALTGDAVIPSAMLVAVEAGAEPAAVAQEAEQALRVGEWTFSVQPTDVVVSNRVTSLSGGVDVISLVLGVFVVIALAICALVVANTFQVLIAQRTRELALLRVLGAGRGSVFAAVVAEAAVVGLIASAAGVLLAIGIMAGLIALADATGAAGGTAVLAVPGQTAPLAIGAGVLVALAAAVAPAAAATRIAPLAALRPLGETSVRTGGGRARLIVGALLFLLGAGIIGAGVAMVWMPDPADVSGTTVGIALALAVAGTLVSALGVVLLSVFVLPAIISAAGRTLGSAPAARLATLNALRNPRRTTATAMALLIGVTLVSTVIVGGQVARTTAADGAASRYPVDLQVDGSPVFVSEEGAPEAEGLPADLVDRIAALDGVAEAVPVSVAYVGDRQVYGVDYERLGEVFLAAPGGLRPTQAIVPASEDGPSELVLENPQTGESLRLEETELASSGEYTIVDRATLTELIGSDATQGVWLRVEAGSDLGDISAIATQISEMLPQDAWVSGAALVRLSIEQVVDMLMLIVTGLLGIAVLIALIGVANTLSLSVIERTRENALLRALGLSKASLRWMLAAEAVLMAVVATALGIGLGFAYGFAGASTVLVGVGDLKLGSPWLPLLAVLGVALVAGLVASVAPARRAARLTPVEGLAAE